MWCGISQTKMKREASQSRSRSGMGAASEGVERNEGESDRRDRNYERGRSMLTLFFRNITSSSAHAKAYLAQRELIVVRCGDQILHESANGGLPVVLGR